MTPSEIKDFLESSYGKSYMDGLKADPRFKDLLAGNTPDEFVQAYVNNDFSGLKGASGIPLTYADQKAAQDKATADLSVGIAEDASKSAADTQTALSQKQLDYQKYLSDQAAQFQTDKGTLDENAAKQGVLFSGMRRQKEQNLANTYNTDLAYKQGTMTNDISNIARDYQYKYGNNAANNLSSYYNLGSNTYNPNVATGGVGSGSLSSVYNPGAYNYLGTQNAVNQYNIQQRAGGLLWNQANKTTPGGNANKYP